ncbi:MAG: transcription termination factor NusA [Clostridia bacterium]
MINKDFFLALDEMEKEKKINKEILIESIEQGLTSAYKKEYGDSVPVQVKLDATKNKITVIACRTVVEEVEDYDKEIAIDDAKEIKSNIKVGEMLKEDITPKNFSRIAAQTAKQVIMQRLNDVKKTMILGEVSDREGEILSGIVRRIENNTVYLEMAGNQLEGVLMPFDQVSTDKYFVGGQLKIYVKSVKLSGKNAQVIVSRSAPNFVKRLFEFEVPEIKAGLVVVKNIVREAGYRTKMAVYSEDSNIDAVGACIGPKGSRINTVVNELNGEKIDIVAWCADPIEFIALALNPAKVLMVQINEEEKMARAVVPDDKLSLAIGKAGQNVRLAAKLTGWKIDVKPYSQVMQSTEEVSKELDDLQDKDNDVENAEDVDLKDDNAQNAEAVDNQSEAVDANENKSEVEVNDEK